MVHRLWLILLVMFGVMLLVAACGDSDEDNEQPSPTPPLSPSPTVIMAAPTQTPGGPTLTPSRTVPPTITPTNSPPPALPTETPLPTSTRGPEQYVIQAGDTCLSIAYDYGHLHPDVIGAIEALNGVQCRALPGPGNTILIPWPTATPTEVGADLTQTAVATSAPPMVTLIASSNVTTQVYVVKEQDTLSSVAIINDTSLRAICELNQKPERNPNGIDCRGCVWESVNCCCPNPPVLSLGQELFVPAPSPTPTLTATFSGSETPTFTPTHRAPQPVYPPDGATIAGPVRLTWLTVGALADDEYYVITARDEATGQVYSAETRQLSLDLPQDYLPADGQSRSFVWQVGVARLGDDGLLYPTGAVVLEQKFTWRGWQ